MTYEAVFKHGELVLALKAKRLLEGGLGMRAAAKQMGVTLATYQRIESGKTFRLKHFISVINWLQASPNVFICPIIKPEIENKTNSSH